jgi:hypothetical protein
MSGKDWWAQTIEITYRTTKHLSQVEPEEFPLVLPAAVQYLYHDIFGTKKGWVLKENVVYTLQKLAEWRDQANGPKIGIVSNFDNRLPGLLAGIEEKEY